MATKQYLQTNAQKFISGNYLHSYKSNFSTIANQIDLTPLQVNQILDRFIKKKKKDFDKFCKTYNINFNRSFSKDLTSILLSGNESADSLFKSKVDEALTNLNSSFFQDISEKFEQFVSNFEPGDISTSIKQKKSIEKQKEIYLTKKDAISKTGFELLRTAFLKDLKKSDPEAWKYLRIILDAISKKGGSTEILAAAIGLTKLSKKQINTQTDFANLKDVIYQNLGFSTEGGSTRKSGIYNNLKGMFSEVIAEETLSRIENISVKGTGSTRSGNFTAKADITIELPNGEDIMGVSVKNMLLIDSYSKTFEEKTSLFKVQDLTLGNLSGMIGISKLAKTIPSISKVTKQIYYLIINEQFFNTVGSRDKTTKTYSKIGKTKKISDFLDSYFLALAGIWFGDGIVNSINQESNNQLMNNGLVYDPSRGIIIPVYKMLEAIQQQISNYGDKMKTGRVDYYFRTNINPEQFYINKISKAPKSKQKKQSYPPALMKVGTGMGNKVKNNMEITVTLLFLDKIIQNIKF